MSVQFPRQSRSLEDLQRRETIQLDLPGQGFDIVHMSRSESHSQSIRRTKTVPPPAEHRRISSPQRGRADPQRGRNHRVSSFADISFRNLFTNNVSNSRVVPGTGLRDDDNPVEDPVPTPPKPCISNPVVSRVKNNESSDEEDTLAEEMGRYSKSVDE